MRTAVVVAASLSFSVLFGGCSPEVEVDPGPGVDSLLTDAADAYVRLDAVQAAELVAAAHEKAPDDPEVILWRARTLSELDVFDKAIPAGERAVEVAPDDPIAWELHLYNYGWGGIYRSNRQWLDRALEIGPEAIRRFPDRPLLYDYFRAVASSGLNQPSLYLQALRDLEPEVGDSTVFRYALMRAELEGAERAGDTERLEELKTRMGEELDALAAAPEHTVLELRSLAYGYQVLEREDETLRWLEQLEATPEGAMLGGRLRSYLIAVEGFENRDDPVRMVDAAQKQVAVIDPAWILSGDRGVYGRLAAGREMELRQITSALGSEQPLDDATRQAYADRVTELAPIVLRAGSTGSTFSLIQAGDALVEANAHLEAAEQLATDAIQALDEERPGLLYAGLRGQRKETTLDTYRASFLRVRGQARAATGAVDDARADLVAAVETSPAADNYRALAEFYRDQDEKQAAYDAYMSALAWGFPRWQQALAERTREEALALADELGTSSDELDTALAARETEVEAERKRDLLDERVGRQVPDVEFIDFEDTLWRLRELEGKVVVLNFWATWCGPCRAEMPHYQALIDEYADAEDVVFLAVSQDHGTGPVLEYLEENGFAFPVALDDGTSNEFYVTGVPSHFLIGPSGLIEYASVGFPGPEQYNQEMRWRIEQLRSEVAGD